MMMNCSWWQGYIVSCPDYSLNKWRTGFFSTFTWNFLDGYHFKSICSSIQTKIINKIFSLLLMLEWKNGRDSWIFTMNDIITLSSFISRYIYQRITFELIFVLENMVNLKLMYTFKINTLMNTHSRWIYIQDE